MEIMWIWFIQRVCVWHPVANIRRAKMRVVPQGKVELSRGKCRR